MSATPLSDLEIIQRYLAGDLTVDAAATAFIEKDQFGFSLDSSRSPPAEVAAIEALMRRVFELGVLQGRFPGNHSS